MRLLHQFTVAELRTLYPDAWKLYNKPNRRWRKDVEKSRAHFRDLSLFCQKKKKKKKKKMNSPFLAFEGLAWSDEIKYPRYFIP